MRAYNDPRGYKLCKLCGCPVLKRGQKRKHKDDYRHASGCPHEDKPEMTTPESRAWIRNR